MKFNAEDLRRHYSMISDDALLAIERDQLTPEAAAVWDAEVHERGLDRDAGDDQPADDDLLPAAGEEPDWHESAACATSFTAYPGAPCNENVDRAQQALDDAAIPNFIVVTPDPENPHREEFSLMVPGALTLHATAILDRDLFNESHEADWRSHLEMLSDAEFGSLNPDIFCAGLLDRVSRLKRAYADELARRRH
jgi:hypothetical protein